MEIILVLALTFLAAALGTLTGFGTSTLMVPVLSLFYPLPEVLLFVGAIHWFGNVWKMSLFRSGARWRLILTFGLPGIIASFLGARISLTAPQDVLSRVLGIFLLTYVGYILVKPKFKLPTSDVTAVVGGTLSGITAGIFGIGGAVRSTFLTLYNLKKAVYIFTSGAIGLVIDTTRITTYFTGGTRLDQLSLTLLILAIPVSLFGALVAKKLIDLVPQHHFRTLIAFFLALIALKFIFLG